MMLFCLNIDIDTIAYDDRIGLTFSFDDSPLITKIIIVWNYSHHVLKNGKSLDLYRQLILVVVRIHVK